MQFVQYGFKNEVDEDEFRTWKTYRMFSNNGRPLFKNFLPWTFPDHIARLANPEMVVPNSMHLFDWLERKHNLDSGFLFNDSLMLVKNTVKPVNVSRYGKMSTEFTNALSNDPLDLMEKMSSEGYEFSKWTAAYLCNNKQGMKKSPIIFFGAAKDAVIMKLSYEEDAQFA